MPRNDLEFLKDPYRWPKYPVCPVKRYMGPGFPECGIVWEGQTPRVWLTNMYTMPGVGGITLEQDLVCAGVATVEYQTWEELVTDGWVVD